MRTKEYLELSIDELLSIYNSNDAEMIRRTNRGRLLNVVISKIEKESDNSELLAFVRVEQYINQFIIRKFPDVRFQSQTLHKTDGTPFENPDITLFTDEDIQLLKEKVISADSVVLKAFYNDFLWFKERDIEFATLAIEAYHKLVDFQFSNDYKFETIDSLDRILAIASEIKNKDELIKAYSKAIELCEKIKDDDTAYLIKSVLMSILKHNKKLDGVIDYSKILNIVDTTIPTLLKENQGQFNAERSLLDVAVEVHRLTKKQDKIKKVKLKIVESFVAEGDWVKEYRKSNMIAAKLL